MSVRDRFFENNTKQKNSYSNVLEFVQKKITDNHAELIADNNPDDIKEKLIQIITKYLNDENESVEGFTTKELALKIYDDMAGGSFLNKYIYNTPNVEEININRWDDVTVTYAGGRPKKIDEEFSSPQQAIDIVKRLIQPQKLTLDSTTPQVISYLSEGVRISASIAPVVSDDDAISASIRIVRSENVTMESLLEVETLTKEMAEFLKLCVDNYISVCIAGATSAGKTTTLAAVLSCAKDDDRVITIEEGSREFKLRRRDKNGKIINNVVSKLTRESKNPDLVINQENLLEHCLRENPDILGIGEMRSSESYTVAEASRTGTATYTTTHADDAENTYTRLEELSQKKYDIEEDLMMKQMVNSFPIIVYQNKLSNGSRKIIEIFEGEYYDVSLKKVIGKTLFKYKVDNNKKDKDGNVIEVIGHFERCNNISKKLYDKFILNGANDEKVKQFYNLKEE